MISAKVGYLRPERQVGFGAQRTLGGRKHVAIDPTETFEITGFDLDQSQPANGLSLGRRERSYEKIMKKRGMIGATLVGAAILCAVSLSLHQSQDKVLSLSPDGQMPEWGVR